MKTRKLISFLVALICVTAMIWMEISITPLDGWDLVPVALLIAAIGIGRMYLFYEGTALREVGTEPARIAFRMSILISVAFAAYVTVLTFLGKADWYQFSLFQLGNIVLLCVEWIFSFRQGSEVNTLLNHFRNRSLAMKSQAEKLRGMLRDAISEKDDLKGKLEAAETEQKRLSSLADTLSAEKSEFSDLLNSANAALSEMKKAAESRLNTTTELAESALNSAGSDSESDIISEETLAELLAEFPNSETEIQKIRKRGSRKSNRNRRDYLKKKASTGNLNGSAMELQILEKLL